MTRRLLLALAAIFLALPLLASAAASSSKGAVADVRGRVRFTGTAPKTIRHPVVRDRRACGTSQPDESMKVSADGSLANVVVSATGLRASGEGAGSAGGVDQIGCRFVPHVLVARLGQTITLGNSDRVLHNIHGTRGEETVFNLAFANERVRRERSLDQPGTIALRCDAGHDWMHAYVVVFDHPWFAVTGSDGRFTLADVPAGKQHLRVWHETLGTKEIDLELGATGADLEIVFP